MSNTDSVAVGGNQAAATVELPYEAAEKLPPYFQRLARSLARFLDPASKTCHEIAVWFTSFAGLRRDQNTGMTVVNSLRSFSWITRLIGHFPVRVTSLFSYEWEGADGEKKPVGEPMAYRQWALHPSFDLNKPEDLKAFDETGHLLFTVRPVSNIIGLKRSKAKLFDGRTKRIKTYDVPRLVHGNFIMVDTEREVDGNVIVVRVRANYLLRLMFRNRNWQVDGRDSQLFANCSLPKAADVTDEFLPVLNSIEGKDIDSRVHTALKQFLGADPTLSNTKLARIMAIQARALAGAHVAAMPGNTVEDGVTVVAPKNEYNLVDRIAMHTTTIRDAYYGLERPQYEGSTKPEFTDFHCQLMRIDDPVVMRAQNLAGVRRFNDGECIIIDE